MSIQYIGLKEINGPMVVIDNVPNVSFDEMVELVLDSGETRLGFIFSNHMQVPKRTSS